MKSIIAAKMAGMRKRSALSSSSASLYESSGKDIQVTIPKQPSSHHGKMYLASEASENPTHEDIDIVLCIAIDSVHAVTEVDSAVSFEASFVSMREIIWDHTERSVRFVLDDGSSSPVFVFNALSEVESQISTALLSGDPARVPEQIYIGALVGRHLPSPIQQRRASVNGATDQSVVTLPASKKRELLLNERPSRSVTPRERLGMEYFRNGSLAFDCQINGDSRGIKLDSSCIYVFPTPDCHDRSACLFSYLYDQVETCEVRHVRLELRFRKSETKQPLFISFQSADAQSIRDAIWYFKFGMCIDVYYRACVPSDQHFDPSSPRNLKDGRLHSSSSRRRNSLTSFRSEEAVIERTRSRCAVVGCPQRKDFDELTSTSPGRGSSSAAWFCSEHAPQLGSPPRSPSKRGIFTKDRLRQTLKAPMVHSPHYARSMKYHSPLIKLGGKYSLTKTWNQKYAALIETPVGSFLCYYDKLAHCPGTTDTPKERRVIELSGVICIRRESTAPNSPKFAFDIVTVYRTWTFAASDVQEYEIWLHLLSEYVERHSSAAPDKPLRFPVKVLADPLGNLSPRQESVVLEVSAHGVTIAIGNDSQSEVYNWFFTDVLKWSVVSREGEQCCMLSCRKATAPSDGPAEYLDFLFQSAATNEICHAIEFFVGKCMAKLEILSVAYSEAASQKNRRLSADKPTSAVRRESHEPPQLAAIHPMPPTGVGQIPSPVVNSSDRSIYTKPLEAETNNQTLKMTEASRSEPSVAATRLPTVVIASRETAIIQAAEPDVRHALQQSTPLPVVGADAAEAHDSEIINDEQSSFTQGSPSPARALPTNPFDEAEEEDGVAYDDNARASDSAQLCQDHCEDVIIHSPDEQHDAEHEGTISASESSTSRVEDDAEANGSTFEEIAVQEEATPMVSSVKSIQLTSDEDLTVSMETTTALVSQLTLEDGLQSYGLPAITLDSTANAFDGDNERFQSFDYVECTLVDAPKPPLDSYHAPDERELQHRRSLFDVFEDALEQLTGGMFEPPATEEVYVVENQLNEEDSLVLLEDSALDAMDAVDDSPDNVDPDDIAPSEEDAVTAALTAQREQVIAAFVRVQAKVCVNEDEEPTHVAVSSQDAALEEEVRITIPTYTLRKRVEIVQEVFALESATTTGDLPPLRSRSPKKRANGSTEASATKAKAPKVELPRVDSGRTSTHNVRDNSKALPDNGEELEVLKCILVREGYLQRLTQASAQGRVSGAHLSATIDVLDLLRIATIEVVEAIVAWRLKRHRQHQALAAAAGSADPIEEPSVPTFQWNSLNYLLKLGSDLDFLDKHAGLTQWLGFTLTRNPFILPVNLEARAKLEAPSSPSKVSGGASNAADVALHRLQREDSSSQFVQVGGKRAQDDRGQLSSAARRAQAAAAKALAERKRPKNPYETRIINDEELVPLPHHRGASARGTDISSRPTTSSSSTSGSAFLLPSQIGDIDMARIRACETIVLQEEALHGRYTRDIQGQLVPRAEAVRRRNMIEMSGDAYASAELSNARIDASISEEQRRIKEDDDPDTRPSAKVIAKKRAGMLGPIGKPQRVKPTRRAPTTRSRGAHLEEVLVAEKERNAELGVLIDRLRETIECKEMDLAYLESVPGVQYYGDELRDFRAKTRRDVAQLRKELSEKLYIYESRAASLFRKEEIIHTFKENRKTAVEAHRTKAIELARPEKALVTSSSSQPMAADHEQRIEATNAERENESNQQERTQSAPALSTASKVELTPEEAEQKTLRHELLGEDDAFTTPVVHDLCATLIQKVARGKLARAAYEVMKIEYYVGSKYIQAVIRGFLARRRVAKMYWQLTASVILQRMIRGMLARRLARKKRQARLEERSVRRLQRVVRGHFGRVRMSKIRTLLSARETLGRSAFELSPSDLKELAAACLDMVFIPSLYSAKRSSASRGSLTPLVLGLVRVLMVLTTDSDSDVDVANVRWKDAAMYLQNGVGLQRRMAKAAHAVAKPTSTVALRHSPLALSLLDMYARDAAFARATFERLERGWRAATAIFDWIHAFAVVSRVQDVMLLPPRPRPPVMASLPSRPLVPPTLFRFADALDATERSHERIEAEENSVQTETVERCFVPRDLVRAANFPRHRPRAMLVVVAMDVPRTAAQRILDRLTTALPGRFVRLNQRSEQPRDHVGDIRQRWNRTARGQCAILGAEFSSVYAAIRLGNSVVLDCDIGLTDAQQRRFVGAFAALNAAIKPSPQCILVRGSLLNRRMPDSPAPCAVMADAKLKATFEDSAEWLHRLAQRDMTTEMETVSELASAPVIAFVVVMEAVVILLTPSKKYEPPKPQPSGVSWRLGRRLLSTPSFLLAKLQGVSYASVSADNLETLQAYLRHDCWPRAALSHAVAAGGRVLHALSSWVEAVVACAVEGQKTRNGLALPITRTHPVTGLFGSVVVYRNVPDHSTQRPTEPLGEAADETMVQAEQHAYEELLEAALVDVRVYRKCHGVSDPHLVASRGRPRRVSASTSLSLTRACSDRERQRRCLVQVFHDCERIFLSAYDPATSFRWQSVIEETDVDALLAPNSIERADTIRTPPATRQEMYDRLVQLCLLEPRDNNSSNKAIRPSPSDSAALALFPPPSLRLVLRPSAVRLYRRVIRLSGRFVTITMAELSRGRIQVDAFLHDTSLELRRVVSLESVLERLSHQDAKNVFVAPERLPAMVLDRLRLYRLQQSAARHRSIASVSTRLGVITRESAPGRVLLRRAIRSPWLCRATNVSSDEQQRVPSVPALWMLTVYELHGAQAFRVEVYQPLTSHRFSLRLSRREFEDLSLASLCARSAPSPSLVRRVLRLLQFDCELEEEERKTQPPQSSLRVTAARVRQIHSRVPLAIPFVSNPHHVVEARRVQRVYLQVETVSQPTQDDESLLQLRFCFPESCEEQALLLDGARIDHALSTWASSLATHPVPTAAWASAPLSTRKVIAMYVARMALRWDPDRARVLALLPSGEVEASICTRDTGVTPSKPPPPKPSRTKRSLFVARSSMSKLPTPSSCVRLLDTVNTRDDDAESERVLYLYDQEELVHKGSYRANGVLVMVQVFMKAVIEDVLQPRMPVDRSAQRDSFEIAFHFYHPGASAATRALIRGRTELRQVVGPDRAELIASETVHELLEHIVERRSIVELETRRDHNDRDVASLRVEFVSDRLYAKQKVTPINESLVVDQQHNDAKLIDARHLRGVKVLSKASVLDGVPGRTIFTVFDVSATNNHADHAGDYRGVQLRVDAYVIATSTRLSLSLEAADFAHVVGDDMELLSAELVAASDERRQQLATRVIEHVAIVRRHDGSLDRLYLQETVAVPTSSTLDSSALVPFGRTVRHVQRRQIVVSLSIDRSSGSMLVRLYEPQQSSSTSLTVSRQTLTLLLGLEDSAATIDSLLCLDKRVKTSAVGHLMAFVMLQVDGDERIEGRLVLDEAMLMSCRAALAAHSGEWQSEPIEPTTLQYLVKAEWSGLRVLEKSDELCAVYLTLEQHVPPQKRQPPVRQHTESELSTQDAVETTTRLQLDATWRLLVSVLLTKRARTESFVFNGERLQQAIDAGAVPFETEADVMNAFRDRLRVSIVFDALSTSESHQTKPTNEATSYRRCHIEWAQLSSE